MHLADTHIGVQCAVLLLFIHGTARQLLCTMVLSLACEDRIGSEYTKAYACMTEANESRITEAL